MFKKEYPNKIFYFTGFYGQNIGNVEVYSFRNFISEICP